MKVLLTLGTSTGGVGRHVHDLAGALLDAGHEVVVAAPEAVARQFGYAALGAAVRGLEVTDRPHPVKDARTVAALRAAAEGVDVVHAHGLRVGALAVLARPGRATPLVVTLHNAAPAGRAGALIHQTLERVVARGSDLVLGVSSDLVRSAQRLGARTARLAIVPAAVAPQVTADRYAVRTALDVPAGVPLLVTVARLAPQKDLALLLEAVGIVRDRHRERVLAVVAGDGPLLDQLQARAVAADLPVRFLGHRGDVPDLLAAADLVVSSARWEGQPVALQEALHLGAAIVATDAGGTADVVGDAAILTPVGDADSLACGIVDVLRHGSVRDDLRAKAQHRAGELPTAADALAAALAAYASIGAR